MNAQLNKTTETPQIPLPVSPVATCIKVNFAVRCNAGHTWGFTMLPSYTLPMGWDTCLTCERENARKQLIVEGE